MSSPPPTLAEQRPSKDLTGKVRQLEGHIFGYGGLSDVYLGVLIETKESVAIKILRGVHTDPVLLKKTNQRINRESHVWETLDHKNILKFLGVCYDLNPSPALISPLCEHGQALKYIQIHSEANRALMIFCIAEGLDYLHRNNVLHGDIKSQNILIDRNGTPLLCDFGRSRILGQKGYTTMFAGSTRYMAPELLLADNPVPTKEGDVYGFGMVGLELLTGKIPFDTVADDIGIVRRVLGGAHPVTSHKAPPGYERTWSVLEDCWSREPKSRKSMDVVVQRLPTK